MVEFVYRDTYQIEDLLEILRILRSEEGCPWDREQDHHSIRENFLEETCEVLEAIDKEDPILLCEELGDVLLQIVFHTRLEEEKGQFSWEDVVTGVCQKMILRHPHVFGNVKADTSAEVLENWDQIKTKEKQQKTVTETLEAVPKTLPALMRSQKVQKRAGKIGMDYPDAAGAMADLKSELQELEEAIGRGEVDAIEEEMGDLLFSCVNLSRFFSLNAEKCLTNATEKFITRMHAVEPMIRQMQADGEQVSQEELDRLWKQAKQELAASKQDA